MPAHIDLRKARAFGRPAAVFEKRERGDGEWFHWAQAKVSQVRGAVATFAERNEQEHIAAGRVEMKESP